MSNEVDANSTLDVVAKSHFAGPIFRVVSSGANDVYNELEKLREELETLKKGHAKVVASQANTERKQAALTSTLRHMANITNGQCGQ